MKCRILFIPNMNHDVQILLSRIRHNIDLVVRVLRSGMLVASIITAQLNKPLADLDAYCAEIITAIGYTIGYNK